MTMQRSTGPEDVLKIDPEPSTETCRSLALPFSGSLLEHVYPPTGDEDGVMKGSSNCGQNRLEEREPTQLRKKIGSANIRYIRVCRSIDKEGPASDQHLIKCKAVGSHWEWHAQTGEIVCDADASALWG